MPRDEAFYAQVMVVRDLYTLVLEPHECVLSLDEKTSIQPRTPTTATKPARPNKVSVRLEHEYLPGHERGNAGYSQARTYNANARLYPASRKRR